MTKPTKSRLGRGLSSLIRTDIAIPETEPMGDRQPHRGETGSAQNRESDAGTQGGLMEIPIEKIRTNPAQPRKVFDKERLAALAESLKTRGALQPIVVRPIQGGYELVAGERRLRASKLAGLKAIPVVVRAIDDEELLEVALVENVQRENLNPVEKARAYRQLSQKHGLSHDDIASRMGEDRTSVSNTIRLLGLSDPCLDLLSEGSLSVGHAKVLLSVPEHTRQIKLANQVIREGWSVRRTEKEAAASNQSENLGAKQGKKPSIRPAVREMQEQLATALGTKVQIREGRRKHSGRIMIEYYNLDDFERILRAAGVEVAEGEI